MKNLKKNWLVVSKSTWGSWGILTQALKNLKNMHYNGLFMFDGSEGWFKIWRKTGLCFQKWQEEFGKFSSEHSKISKLELWWDTLSKVENVWA